MQRGQRLFDIDAGVGRQGDAHAAATGEYVRPHRGAQLRQQHSERRGRGGRLPAGPDRLDQLVAADRARPLEHEVREEHATLPAGKALLDAAALELAHEAPAELHVDVVRALQPRSNLSVNIRESPEPDNRPRYPPMARQITCECGEIVRGETEAEVVDLTPVRPGPRSSCISPACTGAPASTSPTSSPSSMPTR